MQHAATPFFAVTLIACGLAAAPSTQGRQLLWRRNPVPPSGSTSANA